MKPFSRILLLTSVLWGCHKHHTPLTALPPQPPAAPPPVSTPPVSALPSPPSFPQPNPPATLVLNPLEEADTAFDKGKYAEAAHRYETYWQGDPWGERSDEVLFHWALSLALMPNANTDWTRVTSVLNQLITQHPKSPFLPQANAILALASDVQK